MALLTFGGVITGLLSLRYLELASGGIRVGGSVRGVYVGGRMGRWWRLMGNIESEWIGVRTGGLSACGIGDGPLKSVEMVDEMRCVYWRGKRSRGCCRGGNGTCLGLGTPLLERMKWVSSRARANLPIF
ncbi:hypothetical protein BDR22DRAFT_318608 [Usnea florida]